VHQPESVIPPNNRQAIIGCLFVLLGAFGFSAKAVLIKLAYDYSHQLDVITLMVLRMAISLPFFLVVALWPVNNSTKAEDAQRLNRQDWLMIFGWAYWATTLPATLILQGCNISRQVLSD